MVDIKHQGEYKSLFAAKNFRQGEVIIDLPQITMVSPDKYSLEVLPGVHVDCSSSPAGAINHSCNPNSAVRKGRIVAWSCIKEGEEITLDYRRTEQKMAFPFDCVCGSRNCKGRIE